jgi:hypothetical protein
MDDDGDDRDPETIARENHENEIATMITNALWQSKWIRFALQGYEYHGKGFHGVRQTLRMSPNENTRPSMRSLYYRLLHLIHNELRTIQWEIFKHEKADKMTVTAADLFKTNKRRMVTYGLDVDEVSLAIGEFNIFPRTDAGKRQYLEYLRSNGVEPKDVVELESV